MDDYGDVFYKLAATADLADTTCGLKHSKDDPAENHPAVDFLCQDFGYTAQEDTIVDTSIRIPVCQECAEALFDDDWVILICTTCAESQWIYKPKARRDYGDQHVFWLKLCPNCYYTHDTMVD